MTTQPYQQQADSVRAHCIMVSIFREKDSTKNIFYLSVQLTKYLHVNKDKVGETEIVFGLLAIYPENTQAPFL